MLGGGGGGAKPLYLNGRVNPIVWAPVDPYCCSY